jgi:hypothetical protein
VHEPVVLDEAAANEAFLAGSVGDRGRAGVRLQGSGVGEAGPVVADLGEDAGSEQGVEAGEAEQDLAVGVLVEGGFGGRGKVVRGLAGGVQLLEQGQKLVAERLLDGRTLPGVFGEAVPGACGLDVNRPGPNGGSGLPGAVHSSAWPSKTSEKSIP